MNFSKSTSKATAEETEKAAKLLEQLANKLREQRMDEASFDVDYFPDQSLKHCKIEIKWSQDEPEDGLAGS